MGCGSNGYQIRIRRIEKIRMDKLSAHMHVISRFVIQKRVFTRLIKLMVMINSWLRPAGPRAMMI